MGKVRYTIDRELAEGLVWNTTQSWPTHPPANDVSIFAQGLDQIEYSQGNAFRSLGKSQGDIGGPFNVQHKHIRDDPYQGPLDVSTVAGNPFAAGAHYQGECFALDCSWDLSNYGTLPTRLDSYLDVLGTVAISRVIPTNPLSGLTVFLGELRQGLPRLFGADFFRSRAALAKSAGSEYLNYEFGWKPLVSDVKAFARSVLHSKELLKSYEANSGKRIKRHYAPPSVRGISITTSVGVHYPSPTLNTGFYVNSAQNKKIETRTTTDQWWFDGCFTYYLAPSWTDRGHEQRANYLLGTRLTPEVLWDLSPWTWAADWFANFGNVVHNVSAFANDGLVMPYGYVMFLQQERYRAELTFQYKSHTGKTTVASTVDYERKQRRKATPFGFGLLPSSFTNRQWAITSALGLTKGTNRLNF